MNRSTFSLQSWNARRYFIARDTSSSESGSQVLASTNSVILYPFSGEMYLTGSAISLSFQRLIDVIFLLAVDRFRFPPPEYGQYSVFSDR